MPSVKPSFPRLRRDGHWSVRNLVAHYPFYEKAGTVLHDIAGNNDGTLVGGPTWGTGEMGAALDFAGDDDYVDCGTHPSLTLTSLTLSARCRVTASQDQVLIADEYEGYDLYMNGAEHVAVIWYTDSSWQRFLTDDPVITIGAWHDIAATFDAGSGAYAIYVDGLPVPSTWDLGVPGTPPSPQAGSTKLGVRLAGPFPRYLKGTMSGAHIYSRALPASEVAWLSAFPNIVYEPVGMPWLGSEEAAGVTVAPSVAAITASIPGELATGGALIAANVADVLSEAIAGQAMGSAQIAASVADITGNLPAGSATGGAKVAPSVLSVLAELPSETIITGAVVAVDPATAAITVLGVILRTGEVVPPLHLTNLQRQSVHAVDLRRQQVHVGDLRRESIHADLD